MGPVQTHITKSSAPELPQMLNSLYEQNIEIFKDWNTIHSQPYIIKTKQ